MPAGFTDMLRKKMIEPISAAKKQAAGMILPYGAITKLIALQTVQLLVIGNFPIRLVHFGKSLIGAYPNLPGAIFFNRVNGVIRQPIGSGEFLK